MSDTTTTRDFLLRVGSTYDGRGMQAARKDITKTVDAIEKGPVKVSRFDAVEQEIRDRTAGRLRAIREIARRERLEAQVQQRVISRTAKDGASVGTEMFGPFLPGQQEADAEIARRAKEREAAGQGEFEGYGEGFKYRERAGGERHAGAGGHAASGEDEEGDVLEKLGGAFGRGSKAKEIGEILMGGGKVAAFAVIGEVIERAAKAADELGREMRDVDKSSAEVAQDFLESLPIIGGFSRAGAEINELLTGEKAAVDEINEAAEQTNHIIETQAELTELVLKHRREFYEQEAQFADKMGASGLQGNPREDMERQSRGAEERRQIKYDTFDEQKDSLKPINDDIQKAIKDRNEVQKKLAGVLEGQKNPFYNEKNDISSSGLHAQKLELQERGDQLDNKIIGLQGQYDTEHGDIDRRGATRVVQSAIEQEADSAEAARKRAQDEGDKTEQDERARMGRLSGLREQRYETLLQINGQFFSAELAGIHAEGEAKKKAIEEQASDEVKRRMRVLGETKVQAQKAVEDGLKRDRDAIDEDTSARTKAAQERDKRDFVEASKGRAKAVEDVREQAASKILRAAGDESDAEKLDLAQRHKDAVDAINKRFDDEIKLHKEHADELNKQRQDALGAEGEDFAASARQMQRRQAAAFAVRNGTAGGESGGLTGVQNSGFADSQRDLALAGQKELAQSNADLKAQVANLAGILRAIGVAFGAKGI